MAKRKQCYSGIGGQAVLEGIMMKNGDKCAIAVRKSDGTIELKTETYKSSLPKNQFTTLPFVRGVVNFIDSMMLGIKSLNFSTEMTMGETDEEPGKTEKWIRNKFGDKANDVILMITMVISVVFAIGLFMVLPYALSALLGVWIHNKVVLSLAEAIMRFAIFIGYVVLIGQVAQRLCSHKAADDAKGRSEIFRENFHIQLAMDGFGLVPILKKICREGCVGNQVRTGGKNGYVG